MATQVNLVVAMNLAHGCLERRSSFRELLDLALETANPTTIRYWLAAIVPRMGWRRAIAHLRGRADTHRDAVGWAAYWLPEFAGLAGYAREDVRALVRECGDHGERDWA